MKENIFSIKNPVFENLSIFRFFNLDRNILTSNRSFFDSFFLKKLKILFLKTQRAKFMSLIKGV